MTAKYVGLQNLVAMAGLATALALCACSSGVKYPKCDTDDNCKQDGQGNAVNEYCVNGQCQKCREDSHCDMGQTCKSGRCEKKSECPCAEPQVCKADKCVQPECMTNEDCEGSKKCEKNACVDAGCKQDVDCGPNMVCKAGACEQAPAAAGTKVSANCRPMDAANGEVIALQTVNFDFDKFDLRTDAREALDKNAECLQQAPEVKIVLEGHCDDRGTQEYNLALGERRAAAVRDYLANLGIAAKRMRLVSKGKNEPVCQEVSEGCWAKNRRVQFLQSR
jgi:peptidoglycan-associated lipoprotein